jgi:hypothetical protein
MHVRPRAPFVRIEPELALEPHRGPLGFFEEPLILRGASSELTYPAPVALLARAPPAGGAAYG